MAKSGSEKIPVYYLYALLCLCAFVSILDRQALNVLVDPIRRDVGLSDVQMAVAMGPAFGVVYALFAIPIAFFSDKRSRRLVISLGLVVWGAATVMSGLATSFAMLIIARMLLGLGETALTPAAHTMVADLFPRQQLSRALGGLSAAANMSTGLSVTVAGGLAALLATAPIGDFPAWRLTLITIAIPAPILAFLLMATTRDPARTGNAPGASATHGTVSQIWRELRKHDSYLLRIFIGFGLLAAHVYSQMAWFPSYLIRVHGMALGDLAISYGLALGAGGIIGPLACGAIADKLYPRMGTKAPIVTLVLASIASLLQVAAVMAPSPYIAIAIFGVGSAFFAACTPLGSSIVQMTSSPALRARMSAVWLCLFNLVGMGVGPLLVPLLAKQVFGSEAALGPALAVSSTVVLVSGIAIFFAALRRHQIEDLAS